MIYIKIEDIKAYYESLSQERRLKAFTDMVITLNEQEQIRWSDELRLYWTSCGEPI